MLGPKQRGQSLGIKRIRLCLTNTWISLKDKRLGAVFEQGQCEEQQTEALSKCQSVLEWVPARCVHGPARRSSHQSG